MAESSPIVATTEHTPGPWRWEINRKHKSINLCGGLPAGTFDKTVLGFERYGMHGAAPVFHNWTADGWGGKPKRAHELAVEKKGREHHADWFALIDHPNAHLIAAAPNLLAALHLALPRGVSVSNQNVPDDFIIPVDFTMGELRKITAAIARAEGKSNG